MKRMYGIILLIALFPITIFASSVDIAIDSKYLEAGQMDQPAVMDKGRVLVPLRVISEQLGASVNWDSATNKIEVELGDINMELYIDKTSAKVNGLVKQLDTPPTVTKMGRTLVPLRFINENFGYNVQWSPKNRAAHIFTKGQTANEVKEAVDNNRYKDLVYSDLPDNLETRSAWLVYKNDSISDENTYSFNDIINGDQRMIWLSKFMHRDADGSPYFKVKDVLVMPYTENLHVHPPMGIFRNNKSVNDAITIINENANYRHDNYEATSPRIEGLWRANLITEKIEVMTRNGVFIKEEFH